MRILVTCDWFGPTTGGGAERVAYEVSRRLAASGHEVTLVGTVTPGSRGFELPPAVGLISVEARSLARLLRAQVSIAP